MFDILYPLHVVFFVIIVFTIATRNRYQAIINDFNDIPFLFFLALLILFSYWGLTVEKANQQVTTKIRQATLHAIFGFLIAYLAHLDLIFVAYIAIWMLVYHTNLNWI